MYLAVSIEEEEGVAMKESAGKGLRHNVNQVKYIWKLVEVRHTKVELGMT